MPPFSTIRHFTGLLLFYLFCFFLDTSAAPIIPAPLTNNRIIHGITAFVSPVFTEPLPFPFILSDGFASPWLPVLLLPALSLLSELFFPSTILASISDTSDFTERNVSISSSDRLPDAINASISVARRTIASLSAEVTVFPLP